MDRTRLRADAINQGVDAGFKSSVKAAGMTGDRAAAATLAGGHPKATPSPTHPAMSGPQPNDISQNAWKSRPSMTSSGKRFNPAWVYHWLKDPQALRPGTIEPNQHMTDDEARSLTAFLMSLKSGGAQEAMKK